MCSGKIIKCEGLRPILILRLKKTSAGKESKDATWNIPIRLLIYVSINQFYLFIFAPLPLHLLNDSSLPNNCCTN